MTTIAFEQVYAEEFSKLNKKQQEAVETVEGPVMVIAGPGTGKTQILSRRVANILLNHDAKPETIVCLTYTEAGASEMVERLNKLLGETARNVRVSTIHAFCSALILANPEHFKNQSKVIATAIQYELLKSVMDDHIQEGNALYKKSGDRYSSKEQLLDLLSRMKRQQLKKSDIQVEVDDYLKAIEQSDEDDELYKFKYARKKTDQKTGNVYQAGDLKPSFYELKEKFAKLLNGAEIIEKYREKLDENNYFDFDDMILWVKDILAENKTFQQAVSDSIEYLFVDEFQDTSVLQNELINLLVKEKVNPNIFVVGDDDQSIYRFQGVSATNIEDFENKYKPTEIILEKNYRSSQAIIDASRQLIRRNQSKDKNFFAAGANKNYDYILPTLTAYATESDEMFGVLTQVKQLIDKGVTPTEIGIIYGRNAYGKKVAKLFRENGIPVNIKLEDTLFEDAFFKKIYAILNYLNKPNRNINEFRKLLYYDFFNVSIDELMTIRNIKTVDEITDHTMKKIDKIFEKLRNMLHSKQPLSPIYVLHQLIKNFEIDQYIMHSKEKYHLVSVLTVLHELMSNESVIKPELSLTDFLDSIAGLKEMKVDIPINEIEESPDNCVNLMTAHGSKGLEFEYVFMMKCNDGAKTQWPGGENTSGSFSYPPSLSGKATNEKKLKEQENRRLFYVAMTRAKKELHLSYCEERKMTQFINEFREYYQEIDASSESVAQRKEIITVPSVDKQIVQEIASKFSLSVSVLNSFLNCPLSFYFNKVLKFSSNNNEAMVFGNIIHKTLENIYVSTSDDSQQLTHKSILSKDEAIQQFIDIYEQESGKFSIERIRQDNKTRGLAIVENFYNAENYIKPGIIAVEKTIQGVTLGNIKNTTVDLSSVANVTLNGKIDKIEIDGDIIRVIDYKTGSAKNANKKLEGVTDKSPEGEDYWRQAVFYYLLVTNSDIDCSGKQVRIQYVFVEDETNENGFSFTRDIDITEKDVDFVLNQIKDVVHNIQKGDFICGCGVVEDTNKKNGLKHYKCDYCIHATLNNGPLLDNSQKIESASYQKTVKTFKSLSVSTLNRFQTCSNSFYFDNVLKLTPVAGLKFAPKQNDITPKTTVTGAIFGTLMHKTLEKIYKDKLKLDEALIVFDNLLAVRKHEMTDTMSCSEMTDYGHKLINNLFEHYIPNSCEAVMLEKEIHATLDNNCSISGVIDKLEYDNDSIRIVDYKTGFAQNGILQLKSQGEYWRQAVYYTILLKNSTTIDITGKSIEIQYIFLDDTSKEKGYSIHNVTVTNDDIKQVTQQIQDFWNSIQTGQYTQSCGKTKCDFCRLAENVDFELLVEG